MTQGSAKPRMLVRVQSGRLGTMETLIPSLWPVAEMAQQRTVNAKIGGSSPSGPAMSVEQKTYSKLRLRSEALVGKRVLVSDVLRF